MMVVPLVPVNGFLGTGATFAADVNFIVQLAMGGALVIGAILAKQKRYRAHGICQTTVLLLNLWMIALTMWPSFRQQVVPHISRVLQRGYYAIATVHMVLGTSAELLGIYIVLVAGTKLVPPSLRFREWKRWMRIELALWWVALILGIGTYYTWYIAPFR
jgi:uncharacterized membrane protein YozB (DUF420 family)